VSGLRIAKMGICFLMSDPRQAAAATAGPRTARSTRALGWALSVLLWALASDARTLVALLSVVGAAVIRYFYVVTTDAGKGRSVFWSAWFFAVAGVCELLWLAGNSFRI
jgi:hypothetical protein